MLTIRQSQLDVFQDEKDRELIPVIIAYLTKNHAGASSAYSIEELREICVDAVKASRSYNLTTLQCLIWFSAMAIEVSPRFHEQPAINQGLCDLSNPESKRIEALFQRTTEEDWESAKMIG